MSNDRFFREVALILAPNAPGPFKNVSGISGMKPYIRSIGDGKDGVVEILELWRDRYALPGSRCLKLKIDAPISSNFPSSCLTALDRGGWVIADRQKLGKDDRFSRIYSLAKK